MAGIVCGVVRVGVIAALVGTPVALLVGPERIGALFTQAKQAVTDKIDENIKDPVALRSQLRSLEAEYPKRIAEVRTDLTEINAQVTGLNQVLAESKLVVEMADADLAGVQSLISKAELARTNAGPASIVKIRFGESSLDLESAYARANDISQTRSAYASRAADVERDLGYLTVQQDRLAGLLTKLETERSEFQSQLWQLDRQVDAIARNDRMIEMMEKRQATIEEQGRYRAASLDQLNARLTSIRAEQESRLEALANTQSAQSYEQRAKALLDLQRTNPKAATPREIHVEPAVIEVTPDTPDAEDMASRN